MYPIPPVALPKTNWSAGSVASAVAMSPATWRGGLR